MMQNNKRAKAASLIKWSLVLLNVIILKAAYLHSQVSYWWLFLTLPLLAITIIYGKQGRKFY
jgi:hypothetical protein